MNLTQTRDFLTKHDIKPTKLRGQNFLIDDNILNKIISKADLKTSDLILEVGPGLGSLTFELAKKVKQVVCVEKDRNLFEILDSEIEKQGIENVKLISQDILKFDFEDLEKLFKNKSYKVVANLPYNITSKFLRIFLEAKYKPEQMVLMIQREVAQRILNIDQDESMLSLMVNFYCQPKILFKVSPTCFFPAPKVESAVISLENIKPRFELDEQQFFAFIKKGFSNKRKQLKNNLNSYGSDRVEQALVKLDLPVDVRAQVLTLEQWKKMLESLTL